MLFHSTDGQLYLVMHAPNRRDEDRQETSVFIPVREKHGTLVRNL